MLTGSARGGKTFAVRNNGSLCDDKFPLKNNGVAPEDSAIVGVRWNRSLLFRSMSFRFPIKVGHDNFSRRFRRELEKEASAVSAGESEDVI